MTEEQGLTPRENALREDLLQEYYAILGVVSEYDARLVTVKEWSVTVSLAGLAVAVIERASAVFGLVCLTGVTFWLIEAVTKSFQVRYYSRMRDIEYSMNQLNSMTLGDLRVASSPRIDMVWSFIGWPAKLHWYSLKETRKAYREKHDWRGEEPKQREPDRLHRLVRRSYYMGHVLLPHAVSIVLGLGLFLAALAGVEWLPPMLPPEE